MSVAITVGILVTAAVYLMLKPEMLRIVLGFVMLSHAANLLLMASGGVSRREEPFGTHEAASEVADPLPQAFVLTAIVIAFSITIFMLVLAVTGRDEDDDTSTPVAEGADYDADHLPGGLPGPWTPRRPRSRKSKQEGPS